MHLDIIRHREEPLKHRVCLMIVVLLLVVVLRVATSTFLRCHLLIHAQNVLVLVLPNVRMPSVRQDIITSYKLMGVVH